MNQVDDPSLVVNALAVSRPVVTGTSKLIIRRIEDVPSTQVLNATYPEISTIAESDVLVVRSGGVDGQDERGVCLLYPPDVVGKPIINRVTVACRRLGLDVKERLQVDRQVFDALQRHDQRAHAEASSHGESDEIRQLDNIVAVALKEGASDLHFERRLAVTSLRLRIHGEMFPHPTQQQLANDQAENLVRLLMSNLADEGNKPETFSLTEKQQASITRHIDGVVVKMRAQTSEAFTLGGSGQDLVLRLLPQRTSNARAKSLADLGYLPRQIEDLEMARSAPYGVTVFSGITGSGKSTTMELLIREIVTETQGKAKILTVEDPNEFVMPGTTQIPVVRRKDDERSGINPFVESLRAAMRMDGDVIMVGEVRDRESAQCLEGMVLSGHAVFTTTHTTSANNIPLRFWQLGLDRNVLGNQDFLQALVYQRLLQVVCPHCSTPFEDTDFEKRHADVFSRIKKVTKSNLGGMRLRGAGCPNCNHRGVIGRTVCAEVIAPDQKMRQFYRDGRDTEALLRWRGDKGITKTCLGSAVYKLQNGLIDPFEFETAFGRGIYLREMDLTEETV